MRALAGRLKAVKPSPTLAADARAKALIARGVDVVNMGAGEPDFPSPPEACAAAERAIAEGVTRYGPVPGLPELRRAVAEDLQRRQGLAYEPLEEVIVTVGAKQALASFFQAVVDPGDEVILLGPCWVSYFDMVRLAGGVPVLVAGGADDAFVPAAGAIAAAVTPRTRAICLNSPCNPTGAGYPRETVAEVARVAEAHDLWILSDEIYRRLVYDGFEPVSPAELGPEVRARTLVVGGVSKSYAMTGWRIGWGAGPAPLIKAMTTIQSQTTSGAAGICQRAALGALQAPDAAVDEMVATFDGRRRRLLQLLGAIPGVSCAPPRGAFYAFPDVRAYLGRRTPDGEPIQGTLALQSYLLDEAHVAVVAGSVFGGEGHLRLSFATSEEQIATAVERIGAALARLS